MVRFSIWPMSGTGAQTPPKQAKYVLAQISLHAPDAEDEPDVKGYYRVQFLYSNVPFDRPMTAVASTFVDAQEVPPQAVIATDMDGGLDTDVADHEAVRKQVLKLINNFLYSKGYGVYTLEHVAFPGCDQFRGTHETQGPKPETAT
jgi:hypothetical protein